MGRHWFRLLLATGILASALVGALGTASASHDDYAPQAGHAYLPWVPNGAELDGQGPFYGTVTIQNLDPIPAEADVYVGAGEGSSGWTLAKTISLKANESITLSADALGIPSEGASVAIEGWLTREQTDENGDVIDGTHGLSADIAALVKTVSPVASSQGMTSGSHVTVDGYSGLTGAQVESESGQFVLPIAQTNDGWDTTLRVANVDHSGTNLTNVAVTLYGSGGQGFAGESQVINLQIRPGGVESIVLSDHVQSGWVGSAFIESSARIGAVAERHKAGTDMLLTNTSRPITDESQTEQYAPLVFKEYNYWNTGISVANTDPNSHNSITVTYYGPTMNQVGQDTLTIPPRGMEFIYTPGSQDLGLTDGFVGSAKISGTRPFHAAVDQVKYFGNDPDVGQAMSYVVEPEIAVFGNLVNRIVDEQEFGWPGERLALPLVQKGNPHTGTGDTSGIQLFNPSTASIDLEVVFYGANGIPVAPTVQDNDADPMPLSLGGNQSYTLYTHQLSELSSGFQGSVIVEAVGGQGSVTGVSNNVNYAVSGDGSAAFNLVKAERRTTSAFIYINMDALDGKHPGEDVDDPVYSIIMFLGQDDGGRDYPGGVRTIWEVTVPGGCVPGLELHEYEWRLDDLSHNSVGDLVHDDCDDDGVYRVVFEAIPTTLTYSLVWTSLGAVDLNAPLGEYTITGSLVDIERDEVIASTFSSFTIVDWPPGTEQPEMELDLTGLDGLTPGETVANALQGRFYVPGPEDDGRGYLDGVRVTVEMEVPDGCDPTWNLNDYSVDLGAVLYSVFGNLVHDECDGDGIYRAVFEQIPLMASYESVSSSSGNAVNAAMPVGEYTVTGEMYDIGRDEVIATVETSFTIVE